MRKFHGDLLVGGAAIREIDGVIEDDADPTHHPEGRFEVKAEDHPTLELGRPYLLMMENGDTIKLVIKEVDETSDHSRLIVQFESM